MGGIANGLEWRRAQPSRGLLKRRPALNRELGNWAYGAYCLESFRRIGRGEGRGGRGCGVRAEALRTNIGAPLPLDARPLYEPSMAAARGQVGEAAWEAAFAEGMAMSAEEAADFALGEGDHA